MNIPTMSWSPEYRQLLFIGVSTVAVVVFSYDYMTTKGVSDVFFLIIGAGLLLTMLVTVPVLLVNGKQGSD
jgi:hypothetical protein